MPPHILTVFNQLFDELKSMKQQQWTITNYGALILAAIYAVRHQFPLEVSHAQSRLKFLAILTAFFGSVFLLWIQYNMGSRRYRLDEAHNNFFTSNELKAVGLSEKQIRKSLRKLQYKSWRLTLAYGCGGWEFLLALILVLWIGVVLVCGAM